MRNPTAIRAEELAEGYKELEQDYTVLHNPNAKGPILTAILNPHAIPTQSWNPTATQAEEIAKGYKELEIGLRNFDNPW